MKEGTVYQRHRKSCPKQPDGAWAPHRCHGAWAFVVDVGRDARGRRKQLSRGGFPTRRAARAALTEQLKLLHQGGGVTVHRLTVGDYLEQWLDGKRALRPSTRQAYRSHLDNYLLPQLDHLRLTELRADHLDRAYAAVGAGVRGRPVSSATLRRVHATLHSALATAVRRRLVTHNPADYVELPAARPARATVWTVEQVATFLDHTADDRLHPLYHLVVVLGLRRGEALGLRWCDVDLDAGALRVAQQVVEVAGGLQVAAPKTRAGERAVALDPATVAVLRRHAARQAAELGLLGLAPTPQHLLFTDAAGNGLRPEYATRRFHALAAAAGLPPIRLHDLRHTSASVALAAGVALKVVSDRLGHSSTTITADLYSHVLPATAHDAAGAIADLIAGARRATDQARPPPDVSETLAPDRNQTAKEPAR